MKVLLLNGSPRRGGSTNAALKEIAAIIRATGIQAEVIHVGIKKFSHCEDCGKCGKTGRCVLSDSELLNDALEQCRNADGIIFGFPVYYTGGEEYMRNFVRRLFRCGSSVLEHKPAAAIACARHGSNSDLLNLLTLSLSQAQMPIVSTTFWRIPHSEGDGGEALRDEACHTLHQIGRNMVWLLSCIETAAYTDIQPPKG